MSISNSNKKKSNNSKETSIEEVKCTKTCDKTPSVFNCWPGYIELHYKLEAKMANNQNLSYKERFDYAFTEFSEIDKLKFLSSTHKETLIEVIRQLFIEMASYIEDLEKRGEIQAISSDNSIEKEKTIITIEGFKNKISQKFGYFLSNKFNKDGVNMAKIHLEAFAKLIAEHCVDPEGNSFNRRTFFDGMITGANLKEGVKPPQ